MTTGIYKILCATTGRYYIGSAVNAAQRWRQHLHQLRRGTHRNPKLQAAWTKYGERSFTWEIVEVVPSPSGLLEREQIHLDVAFAAGVQLNVQSVAASALGTKRSPEVRAKMSLAQQDPVVRANFSAKRKGHLVSTETREKIAAAHRGKKEAPEAVARRVSSRRGYEHSEETVRKISLAQRSTSRLTSVIDSADVAAIKARVAAGESQSSVARDFAITQSYVSRVVSGNRWVQE